VHLDAGESRSVGIDVDARAMSAVDSAGRRAVLPGDYRLSIGSTQPFESRTGATARFTVRGSKLLEK
jgi:beta-glucosidase